MTRTALTEKFMSTGARIGEYCGAETALSFGDKRGEFNALLQGCGICDLGWRSKLIISGKDRMRWLNGMITNNIRDLPENRGNYSFLLTPQGRIQGDLYAYNRGEYLMLGTERFQTPAILDRLKKYIIMDKVEIEDVSDRLTAIGVQGPKAKDVLGSAGFNLPDLEPMQIADISWREMGLSVTRMAGEEFATYELWVAAENAPAVWEALVHAGAVPVGMDALELFRVAAGIPRYGLDITDRDLPQETGQQQALNFNKGCYVGQEIVERIRARGNVHRALAGFVIEGGLPESHAKVTLDGKEIGEVTSALAVPSGDGERIIGLGIIRREAAKPGTAVRVSESTAIVTEMPFPEAFGEPA